MKRIGIVAIAIVMVFSIAASASAANSLTRGVLGLGFNFSSDEDNMIFGKYLVENDLAILAGFGLGFKGGDADGTDLSIAGGVRKYLRVDDFAPFVGGLLAYRTSEDGDLEEFDLLGQFGAEYFLAKQFSVEGSIGVGYNSVRFDVTTPAGETSFTDSTFGTSRANLSVNLYF